MPTIEFVTVANHAEAINGLLYLQGAGQVQLPRMVTPEGSTVPVAFGIGVSMLVGWNETNQAYPFELVIVHEDGGEPLVQTAVSMEAGRPAGMPPGADLRHVLAMNAHVAFPRPGGYQVRATLAASVRAVSFQVRDMPAPPGSSAQV